MGLHGGQRSEEDRVGAERRLASVAAGGDDVNDSDNDSDNDDEKGWCRTLSKTTVRGEGKGGKNKRR